MIETTHLKKHLSKAFCSRCASSLDTAELVPVSELPLAVLVHAVCNKCKSENMITITSLGTGVVSMVSDLTSSEVRKFLRAKSVTYDEVLAVHKKLKKGSICNLLQRKEQNSAKKLKT